MVTPDPFNASILTKNLNDPVLITPSLKTMLRLSPGNIGLLIVIVSADRLELLAPPAGCSGGSSRRRPSTTTGPPTPSSADVSARRSAHPAEQPGVPKDVMLMIRNRSRDMGCPVLLVMVRRMSIVP